jgi:hypothetical protein
MPKCRALSPMGKMRLRIPACPHEINKIDFARLKFRFGASQPLLRQRINVSYQF